MSMYKQLIYGVTILLIGAAGYYFNTAGVPGLIVSGSTDKRGNGVSAAQVFSGTYLCDETSGCKNPIKLILEDDTTVDIIATVDEHDSSLGQGTWNVSPNGSIVMALRNPGIDDPNYPSTVTASKVSSVKITGFSSKSLLPGMEEPVFRRVKTDEEIQREATMVSQQEQAKQHQEETAETE